MPTSLHDVQWLFLDPAVLLNSGDTDREARRQVAAALSRRGRPVSLEQVERAWMQAISSSRPVQPLQGALQILAPDTATAGAIGEEVSRTCRNLDSLFPGTQLTLNTLHSRFKLGVIGPYKTPGTRAALDRFHLGLSLIAISDEQKLSHQLDPTGRPDPALFTWALRKVGCPAARAAFASDRVDLGIAPANMAGMVTIWLRQSNYKVRYPRSSAETPDITANSLAEFAQSLPRA